MHVPILQWAGIRQTAGTTPNFRVCEMPMFIDPKKSKIKRRKINQTKETKTRQKATKERKKEKKKERKKERNKGRKLKEKIKQERKNDRENH